MDALEHERPALLERPLRRGADTDEDVPRLLQKAVLERVVGVRVDVPRLEARLVDRGHEGAGEERAHGLPHEVGRGDARDSEAVRELGRDRRFAGARRAADEDHDRQVDLAELLIAAQTLDRLASLLLAEHLDRERLEPLELDAALAAFAQLVVDAVRQRIGTVAGDPGGHERARHQPTRVRQPKLVAAQRQGVDPARLVHARTACFARERTRSSSSSETTSFAARTTSAPRASAASATTSTAAALSSTR